MKGIAQRYFEKRVGLDREFVKGLPKLLAEASKKRPGLNLLTIIDDNETSHYRLGPPGYVELYSVNNRTGDVKPWPPGKIAYENFASTIPLEKLPNVALSLSYI